MKIGDVYYEKHTVVGISKRTGTVSETDVEIVNVLPIDVLDKIKDEIDQFEINGHIKDVECFSAGINTALNVIDKYKTEKRDDEEGKWFNMNNKEKLINQYKEALKEAQDLYLSQEHTEEDEEKRKREDINKLEEFIKIIYGM